METGNSTLIRKFISILCTFLIAISATGQPNHENDALNYTVSNRILSSLKPINRDIKKLNKRKEVFVGNKTINYQSLKSANTVKQRLDSVVVQEYEEYSSRLVNSTKEEIQYDSQGKALSFVAYKWDKPNNKWVQDYKSVGGYDSNGHLELIIDYNWDITAVRFRNSKVKAGSHRTCY